MQDLIAFTNANMLLVSGLIASGLAVVFFELRLKARGIAALPTAVAVRVINSGAQVVDIRPAEKFAEGHIIDAQNIQDSEVVQAAEQFKNSSKGALLVCENGGRSGERAAQLRKEGMENVFSMRGGMTAWQQENFPVTRAPGDKKD